MHSSLRQLSGLPLAVAVVVGCSSTPAPDPTPTVSPSVAAATPSNSAPTPASTPTAQPGTPTPTQAGSTTTPVPATPLPTAVATQPAIIGTTGRIVNPGDGYAITLPEGWTRFDLTAANIDAVLEAAIEDPVAREAARAQLAQAAAAGWRFMAFRNADLASDFATNVNVISAPSMGLSLDVLEQLNIAQLEQLPALEGEIDSERIILPSGEALHLKYKLSNDLAGTYAVNQHVIPAGNAYHVLTVTGLDAKDIRADANSMAQSFDLLVTH